MVVLAVLLFYTHQVIATYKSAINLASTAEGNPDIIVAGEVQRKFLYPGLPDCELDYSTYKSFWVWETEKEADDVYVIASSDKSLLQMKASLKEGEDFENLEYGSSLELKLTPGAKLQFTLYFECLQEGSADVEIFILHNTVRQRVFLIKNCPGGPRDDLTISANGITVFQEGKFMQNKDEIVIQYSPVVSIQFIVDMGNQYVPQYEVTSVADVVQRGSFTQGKYLTTQPIFLELILDESSQIELFFEIDIPPFDSLYFRLVILNDMQYKLFKGVNITVGTSPDLSNIINDGQVDNQYKQCRKIGADKHNFKFFVSSKDHIEVSAPIMSFNNEVLRPGLHYKSLKIGQTPSLFTIFYRCIADGSSDILITFPVGSLTYEFCLSKTCEKPAQIVEKSGIGFGAFFMFGLLVIIGLLGVMRYKNIIKI